MRFLHLTDTHLGYAQYNLSERFNDFGRAFERAIQYGIDHSVDAILIAGDIFHKAVVEPLAFVQAADTLGLARQAKIPIIAVEGNHDQARYRDQISWLDVLAYEGYLILLRPELKGETAILRPWGADEKSGSYLDIKGVRIVGLPWLGAAAAAWFEPLIAAIQNLPQEGVDFTVLLTHAGLEGEMPKVVGCLTYAQLEPLHSCIDYLALGHLHKPFDREGWVYNPGSLETCEMGERKWMKGWYDVQVEAGENPTHHATFIPSPHRPFLSDLFTVEPHQQSSDLLRALRDQLRQWKLEWDVPSSDAPVVEVRLEDVLQFDRSKLDLDEIGQIIKIETGALHALVNVNHLRLRGMEIDIEDNLSPEKLEQSVLREIALGDSRFASQPDSWAQVMWEIKDLALQDKAPGAILETLQARIDELGGAAHVD